MTYYTLTQSDMQYFAYMVPKDIRWQIQKSGYYTIGALETGNFAAGVLQFYIGPTNKRNTFEATITYMYVDKNFRRSGVGTLLLMEMDRILESSGINYRVFVMPGDGSFVGMKSFLEDYGFEFRAGGVFVYSEPLAKILVDQLLKEKVEPYVKPLQGMSQIQFRTVLAKLENASPEELASDFERRVTDYDPGLCSYYATTDGSGLFLVKRYPSGRIEPVLLRTMGKDAMRGCLMLVARSAKAAKLSCGTDDLVRFFCRSEESEDLMRDLMPDLVPEEELLGVYGGGEDDE